MTLTGVEAAVHVEQRVAFVVVRARVVRRDDFALGVEVAGVEELEVLVAELAAWCQVPLDVVELAKPPAKGDMAVICEARSTEDDESILYHVRHSCEAAKSGVVFG